MNNWTKSYLRNLITQPALLSVLGQKLIVWLFLIFLVACSFKREGLITDNKKPADVSLGQLKEKDSSDPYPLVVIDPGHGGDELGAVGRDGIFEKDVVLDISLTLDELLREKLAVNTKLTRARDQNLTLAERTAYANNVGADIFISIHTNASSNHKAHGIETYYLDNTNDKSSLKLAERENSSAFTLQPDLQFILSDVIQNAKLEESIVLAHYIQDSLVGRLSKKYPDVKNLGVKRAPFYILVGAHMPCVLVEVSFIDHPQEGKRLATRKYQKEIAKGIYQAIENYFMRHNINAKNHIRLN